MREAVLRGEPLAAAVAEAVERRVVLSAVALGAQVHLDVAVVGDGLDDHAARLAHLVVLLPEALLVVGRDLVHVLGQFNRIRTIAQNFDQKSTQE